MSNVRYLPMTLGIFILVIAFISSITGPESGEHKDEKRGDYLEMSLAEMRSVNRDRLQKLALGMTREQAMKTMGTQTFYQEDPEFRVPNPYRRETYQAPDGTTYELLSYYTELNREDYELSKDEMTPLMFQNDKLVGWGWSLIDKLDMRHTGADTPVDNQPLEK